MNGFTDTVNGFSLAAIQSLQELAESWYLSAYDPLPLPDVPFDVTSATDMSPHTPLEGDGTDESALMEIIAADTSITNWYFPAGTFLLSNIVVGSHLKAIYGVGTIESLAYSVGDANSPYGAIKLDHADLSDFVVDGITFTQEDSPNWGVENDSTRWYGLLTFAFDNVNKMEIRNCSFDNRFFNMNGIKCMSGGTPDTNVDGLRIHNNVFTNSGEFGLELIVSNNAFDGSTRFVTGLRVHDNHFSGSESRAMSIVKVRGGIDNTGAKDGTESYVYNNTFDGTSWAMEIGHCSGVYTHNNYAINIIQSVFNQGGHDDISIGKNFLFNNHLEGDGTANNDLVLYSGDRDEYYNNYINARVKLEGTIDGQEWDTNFHDNTLIQDIGASGSSYQIYLNNVQTAEFNNNDIYSSVGVLQTFHLTSTSGGLDTIITNNNINMINPTGTAIMNSGSPITESGNIVVLDYSGEIPTSRPGAGLLP